MTGDPIAAIAKVIHDEHGHEKITEHDIKSIGEDVVSSSFNLALTIDTLEKEGYIDELKAVGKYNNGAYRLTDDWDSDLDRDEVARNAHIRTPGNQDSLENF